MFPLDLQIIFIDHLYTNITKETYCGVCLYEVSDHIPTFFIVPKFKCCLINKQRLIRCMKNFNFENFLVDMKKNLSKIDFDSPNSNINNDVCNSTITFKTVLNKHVPLRTMTRKEKILLLNGHRVFFSRSGYIETQLRSSKKTAAVTSPWRYCVRFDRPRARTPDLPHRCRYN